MRTLQKILNYPVGFLAFLLLQLATWHAKKSEKIQPFDFGIAAKENKKI